MRKEEMGSRIKKIYGYDKTAQIQDGKDLYSIYDAEKRATSPEMQSPQPIEFGIIGMGGGLFDLTKGTPNTAELEKKGFKKSGTGKVGKDNCDIFKGKLKARFIWLVMQRCGCAKVITFR